MKKVVPFALTVVAAALLATACQKNEEVVPPATEVNEGLFKPEKKLSKIYQTVEVTLYGVTHTIYENLLIEDWTWDGDKLVNVNYYSSDGLENSVHYIYSGNVITKMQQTDAYDDVIYDGGRLKEIKEYALDGTPLRSIAVTKRDGNKITEFTLTEFTSDDAQPIGKHAGALRSLLRMLVPDNAAEQIAVAATKDIAAKEGNVDKAIVLIWDGDNVAQVVFDHFGYETRMFYEYDTMKSPFQGFIGYIGRDMHYGEWGSRNNSVMDSISTPFVDMQECVHFTYEYVDGYPVKRTHIIPNGGMDGKMEVRYEYEE